MWIDKQLIRSGGARQQTRKGGEEEQEGGSRASGKQGGGKMKRRRGRGEGIGTEGGERGALSAVSPGPSTGPGTEEGLMIMSM